MDRIEHFELRTPQVATLPLAAGCTVRVNTGLLWLTQDGRPDDVWLAAGQRWTAPDDCRVRISAEPDAAFQIARPALERSRSRLGPISPLPA